MRTVFPPIGGAGAWLRAIAFLALLACAWALPGRAQAANTCWVDGNTPVAFGTVTGGGGTTSATLRFICQNDGPAVRNFRVCLYMDPTNVTTGLDPRRLVNWNSGDFLNYNLYADPAMSQTIGATTSGHAVYSTVLTTTSNGQSSGSMQIYGRALANQTVAAGAYFGFINDVLRAVTTTSGSTVPSPAQCATPTSTDTNFTLVTASFADTCYISTATDIDFGSVANLTTARNQTSAISLRCPTGANWQVALNYGNNANGTTRRMIGPGGNYITYQLYRDAARTQTWGNTTSTDVSGTGNGATQTLTVYGRAPVQAVGAPGTYSDTVTITLTY